MRYQKPTERRAVILMVVLSLLTLFALVGVTFVLYADAEAAAARVAREAQTLQAADVNPEEALSYFLNQLIYDVPDTVAGAMSGLRGHSLSRTMYGLNYPGVNAIPYSGIGRLHAKSPLLYPLATPLTNVPQNWIVGGQSYVDDYALVNYTWFQGDGFVRDPERLGSHPAPLTLGQPNPLPYVGGNAPYTYPDLNSFFLAAMKADGTVLTPSYHRPWLFQAVTVNGAPKLFAFNDMSNPNWTNQVGKYLTLRPRPVEHPLFPLPGDATGDVKNLPWAPGGNDSIWVDLGAPVMTAPDGTKYKMMFAPLIIDLDGRINLNTAGNILAYIAAMTAPASWQQASSAHVSNQGWGPWEVNLSKVLWAEQALWAPSGLATPPEWMRLLTGMSHVVPTPPNLLPVVQPGVLPYPVPIPNANLSAWLLPGVRGRYLESMPGGVKLWTPNTPPASAFPFMSPVAVSPFYWSSQSLGTTYPHSYAMADFNSMNEANNAVASSRPLLPGYPANPVTSDPLANPATNPFASFQQGFLNGNATEITNHPLLYNIFQSPLTTSITTRAFRASDMEFLLRPNASQNGPVDANSSATDSDLMRLCPLNFPNSYWLSTLPPAVKPLALRFRNLVTTQSWDLGSPGVTPYWWTTGGYMSPYANAASTIYAPFGSAVVFPTQAGKLPPSPLITNVSGTNPVSSEFGLDWRSLSADTLSYLATQYVYGPPVNAVPPQAYTSPGARIRLNRPLPPYPHMGAGLVPPYTMQPPTTTLSPYGVAYDFTNGLISNQYLAAQNARQALANDIYRRLLAIVGLPPVATPASPNSMTELAPRRWLAQLAVNIVDYIDEDDVMTPFNFYTAADINPANPAAVTAAQIGTPVGPDDATPTGANPAYWVFGTELPKVVLSEVVAQAQNSTPTAADPVNPDYVNVWAELFNTMPDPTVANPTTFHTQPQDASRVPLYITNPKGTSYSPYRITIAQTPMQQPPSGSAAQVPDTSANPLGKAYVAGPYPQSTTDGDFSGTIPLIGGGNQAGYTVPGTGNTINAGVDASVGASPTYTTSPFVLVGPPAASSNPPFPAANYQDPFVAATATTPLNGVPANTPVLRTNSMSVKITSWTAASTTDERTTGLTVMLRRLANPYLPFQGNPGAPNYNPYVTVDYIQNVPIQNNKVQAGGLPNTAQPYQSRGKEQPFASLTIPQTPPQASPLQTWSPVMDQLLTANPPPASAIKNNNVANTFGYSNWPVPPSGHYDWLVHLDRPPISPLELLHVSAFPPYLLTQFFMTIKNSPPTNTTPGSDNLANNTVIIPTSTGTNGAPPSAVNALNMFGHYAPWFDAPPPGITAANLYTMSTPWWFNPNLSWTPGGQNSHRLYRLFEYLECGDRAFGVNGLGRIPGKVNINTIWDAEILQALIDANQSMGILPSSANTPLNTTLDPVAQVFSNMMLSRSPSYYNSGAYNNSVSIGPVNMGTAFDDRPFMPLSTGLNLNFATGGGSLQFPGGLSVSTDTILRTNNPSAKPSSYPGGTSTTPAPNLYLLFQNYNDAASGGPTTTSAVHPYLQTQMLNKLYNNITTRSNTFAVFLTVGFFQVLTDATGNPLPAFGQPPPPPGTPYVPQLGPEIGRSEGKQIRHRMFAILDRTNLATFTTTGQAPKLPAPPPPAQPAVTGPTPNPLFNAASVAPYYNPPTISNTGVQTINLPLATPPNTTVTGNPANAAQLFVANPITGIPGIIQPGTQLVIDPGQTNEETVTVISVTPPASPGLPAAITANFTLPHGVGGTPFTIIQRGNPGPWLFTPYDPRLDPGVVQYFSIID